MKYSARLLDKSIHESARSNRSAHELTGVHFAKICPRDGQPVPAQVSGLCCIRSLASAGRLSARLRRRRLTESRVCNVNFYARERTCGAQFFIVTVTTDSSGVNCGKRLPFSLLGFWPRPTGCLFSV